MLIRVRQSWLSLVMATACSHVAPKATSPGPSVAVTEPVTLLFRWPAPVTALVHATSVRAEATVKSRYSVSLAPSEDGKLLLSFDDFSIVEINGIVPSDFHTVSANLDSVANLAAVMPALSIERSGFSVGLVSPDDALADMVVARAEHDPIVAELLLDKLADARARKVFEHQYARPWRHWVESWLGLELYRTGAGFDVVITPEVRKRHGLGVREITARARGDDPALLELEKRFWVDGEAGRRMINNGVEPVFGLLGIPEMVELRDLTVEAVITALMDIRTLQPRRVESRLTARARSDHGVIEHHQADIYEIEWLALDEVVPPKLESLPP